MLEVSIPPQALRLRQIETIDNVLARYTEVPTYEGRNIKSLRFLRDYLQGAKESNDPQYLGDLFFNHSKQVEGSSSSSLSRYLSFYTADYTNIVLTPEEKSVFQTIFADVDRGRARFLHGIFNHNRSLQDLMGAVQRVLSPRVLDTFTTPYTIQEAELMARQDMYLALGPDYETKIAQDPDFARVFQRRTWVYELQDNPLHKVPDRPWTVEEVQEDLLGVMAPIVQQIVIELIRKHALIHCYPVKDGIVSGKSKYLKIGDLPHLEISSTGKDLGIKLRDQSIVLFYHNSDDVVPKIGSMANNLDFICTGLPLLVNSVVGEKISHQELINFYQLSVLTSLMTRIGYAIYDTQELVSIPPFVKTPLSEELQELSSMIQDLNDRPELGVDWDDSAYMPDIYTHVYRISEFFKWQAILAVDNDQSLQSPVIIDSRFSLASLRSLLAGIQFKSNKRISVNHIIGHDIADVSRSLNSFKEYLAAKLTAPDFRITGNNTKAIESINELSTYPTLINEGQFVVYENPEPIHDPIIITSNQYQSYGVDSDGQTSFRLWTPEFARVGEVRVFLPSGERLSDDEVQIEYEKLTGHYRLVITSLDEKDITAIKYEIEIDPESKVSNAPEKVSTVDITELSSVKEFNSRLRDAGFLIIADNIDKLLSSDRPLSTEDFLKAFKGGARYAFALSNDGYSQYEFDYMPNPNAKGIALVQCSHSAEIFSEFLNTVLPEGQFYSVPMRHTFLDASGILWAEHILHAETRGNLLGSWIRHDATPIGFNWREFFYRAELKGKKQPMSIKRLDILVADLQETYRTHLKNLASRNYAGRIHHNFRAPEGMRKIGIVLREIREQKGYLFSNPQLREVYLDRLENLKKIWVKEADQSSKKDSEYQRKYKAFFGPYATNAGLIITLIDETIEILQDIGD